MTDYQLQATFKLGSEYDDAWVTIGSNDPNEFKTYVNGFREELLDTIAQTANTVRATNQAVKQLGATPVAAPAAPSYSAPAAPAPAQAPAAPAPAASAPSAPTGGALPGGVVLVAKPDPKKPQYQALFMENMPYIADKAQRDAFMGPLKNTPKVWAKFDGESKSWYVSKNAEQFVRDHFAANAAMLEAAASS